MKKPPSTILVSVLLFCVLSMLTGFLPTNALAAETIKTGFEGKTISILGDSISTYVGVSNDATVNSTLSGGLIYYKAGTLGVYRSDTWWQQAIDTLGLELLVNNSWSASCVLTRRFGASGAYINRCVQLHNQNGTEPDIIAVHMGTNDFWGFSDTLGTADTIDYDSLIIAEEDEGFSYATPTTACEAYAIMLHKMTQRYPDAEIYCFTLPPRSNQTEAKIQSLEDFNTSIALISNKFGAYIVDLYNNSGIKADENFQFYIADDFVHPGPAGMDAITGCFTSTVLECSQYTAGKVYDVSYDLDKAIVDQGTAFKALDGSLFTCSFTVPTEHTLSVSVSMDGEDVTDSCVTDQKITIGQVTGDIQISAQAIYTPEEMKNFRWECQTNQFMSISDYGNQTNDLTKTQGSIVDGTFNKANYTISEALSLRHDKPWVLEWREQILETDTIDGALLLASASVSNAVDKPYLYRPQNSRFLAIGMYKSGAYHNYGIALKENGIDGTTEHTYRLTNRIFEDGSNMIYLYVDGKEIGPMNHYWVGGTDQQESVDWVSGQDFKFTNIGTASHSLHSCSVDYIQVWEDGHTHSYTSAVTAPTCTEQGYTTYTCACSDRYVENYVDATGHDYRDGACSQCGKAIPVLTLRSPSLEFKDMIKVVAFFTAENAEDVVEMGMITYSSRVSEWNIDNAEYVIPGAVYVESSGRYYATSQGIHAKQLADDVYLAVYARLTNGSYIYSKLASYSAATYAYNQLESSDDVTLKQLVVSMLNYGAQAQRYFSHNVDNLANAGLTEEQMALPEAYRADMVQSVPAVSDTKQGTFLNNQGFASRRPAVSFEGAFCINYFFTPAYTPVGEITMCYWNEADFNAAEIVTAENASGSLVMVNDGSGQYRADITGIAAKDLSGAVYVAALYSDGTESRTSGVLGYSIGAYCGSQAARGGAVAELAKATAVYGHHAKEYFG